MLSASQAATALRPFYFTVHPDLFGQFPKERAINEESLKQLSQYVTTLQSPTHPKPVSLTFYTRSQSHASNALHKLSIHLDSRDLHHTVTHILQSCQLPLDALNDVAPTKFHRALNDSMVQWDHWDKLFMHRVNPVDELNAQPTTSLRQWLSKNTERARTLSAKTQSIRDDIDRLCASLKAGLHLTDIRWDSPWSLEHFRRCLRNFESLYLLHPQKLYQLMHDIRWDSPWSLEHFRRCLRNFESYLLHPQKLYQLMKGKTLVLSNMTGVSLRGEVLLSSDHVTTDWLKLMLSIPSHDAILQRLPTMENRVSELLGHIKVVHNHPHSILAHEYELLLNRLLNSLRVNRDDVVSRLRQCDLSQLELVVEHDSSPPLLTSIGQFLMPASYPAQLIAQFISENQEQASQLLSEHPLNVEKEASAISDCLTKLHVTSIAKDPNLNPMNMYECCQRLGDDEFVCRTECLRGVRLRVAYYFSVKQDGELCVPWDWIP